MWYKKLDLKMRYKNLGVFGNFFFLVRLEMRYKKLDLKMRYKNLGVFGNFFF